MDNASGVIEDKTHKEESSLYINLSSYSSGYESSSEFESSNSNLDNLSVEDDSMLSAKDSPSDTDRDDIFSESDDSDQEKSNQETEYFKQSSHPLTEKELAGFSQNFTILNSYFEQEVGERISDFENEKSTNSATGPTDLLSRYKWIDDPDLPAGWKKRFLDRARMDRKRNHHVDCFFLSPCGKQFRSTKEVKAFISANKKSVEEEKYFKFLIKIDFNK